MLTLGEMIEWERKARTEQLKKDAVKKPSTKPSGPSVQTK